MLNQLSNNIKRERSLSQIRYLMFQKFSSISVTAPHRLQHVVGLRRYVIENCSKCEK